MVSGSLASHTTSLWHYMARPRWRGVGFTQRYACNTNFDAPLTRFLHIFCGVPAAILAKMGVKVHQNDLYILDKCHAT